eukprot:4582193-Amphidinium_carterae.1
MPKLGSPEVGQNCIVQRCQDKVIVKDVNVLEEVSYPASFSTVTVTDKCMIVTGLVHCNSVPFLYCPH